MSKSDEERIVDAIKSHNLDWIAEFIKKNPDYTNEKGYTTLHLAAFRKCPDVVEFLINNKSDVNAKTSYETPLWMACANGDSASITLLLAAKAEINPNNPNPRIPSPFITVVANELWEVAETMLAGKADPNVVESFEYNSPLHYAAEDGKYGLVKALLENGANKDLVNGENKTPLDLASTAEISDLLSSWQTQSATGEPPIIGESEN